MSRVRNASIVASLVASFLHYTPVDASAIEPGGYNVLKGEISRAKDGKLVVKPFPKPATRATSGATCKSLADDSLDGIRAIVEPLAAEHGVNADLVMSVIAAESNFNINAVSHKNAQGLMQLLPSTARMLGVKDTFNPEDNIRGGVKYLRQLLDLHDGNVSFALSSYNSGPANTLKYGRVSPFAETVAYVAKIQGLLDCNRNTLTKSL